MSTLMKGFNIPKHSGDTNIPELHKACIKVYSNGTAELVLMKTKEHYPLINIPTPHGDLIDRNMLNECFESLIGEPPSVALAYTNQYIDLAETVIEAED